MPEVTVSISTMSQPIQDPSNLPPPQPPKIAIDGVPIPAPEEQLVTPCGVQVVVLNSGEPIAPASIVSNQWQFLFEEQGGWYLTYRQMWEDVATQLLSAGDPQEQLVFIASFGLDVMAQPTAEALEQFLLRGAGPQLQRWASLSPVSEGGYYIEYPANYALIGNSGFEYAEGTEEFDYSGESNTVQTTITATLQGP